MAITWRKLVYTDSPTFTGILTVPAVKITTGAGAGKVLTSDADGNASWEDPTVGGDGVFFGGLFEIDSAGYLTPLDTIWAIGSNLFEVDINGSIMPSPTPVDDTDENFELDANDNIQPILV